jgi:hypothetical protein
VAIELITALVLAGLASGRSTRSRSPLRYGIFLFGSFPSRSRSRDICRWRCEHRTIALRLVQRSSLVALDVLEFRGDHAGNDALYLLPDTGGSSKEEIPPAPSFAGFLYATAGFAMLYAAIDQGERLDWWRSVVFTALFVGGSFFLLCSLVRRLRSPNPLVDMPYLRQWNTVLLGILLFFFRFFW